MTQLTPSAIGAAELIAAVDLGSNSFHLVIARIVDGALQLLHREKQKVLLADGLDEAQADSARAVKRIEDVKVLRAAQFPEDAGPMAHPIRPDSYQEINNHYTVTVYEKGAEVIRMQHTLLGEGRLDYAGVKHRLTPGKTMLVTMPHAHRYWLERGGHWEYFWFLISGREALRMARAILEAAGPVLTPSEGAVEQMAAACLRLLSPPVPNAAEASAAGYAALCALHDAAFADAAAGIAPSPKSFAVSSYRGDFLGRKSPLAWDQHIIRL